MSEQQKREGQRHMLAATSVTGLASVGNIAISIVRVKVVALLVGPAGIGLLGLYLRLTSLVATLSGLGLSQSGVREVAASKGPAALAATRRALLLATLVMGVLAGLVMWLFRAPLARAVFKDDAFSSDVAWLGFAVVATGLSTAQTAYLQGLRRIKDAALVTVLGAFFGTLVGLSFVWVFGREGLVALVIASPVGGAAVAWWFSRRARHQTEGVVPKTSWAELAPRWRALATMGLAVMISQVVSNYVALEARAQVVEAFGLAASGFFEASWQISMTYIGFVLTAMGADYFPRLTSAIAAEKGHAPTEEKPSHRLVNDQAEVALLLAAPVLVGLAGLAPVGIHILYSGDFSPSVDLLRVQALGDTLKILAWPLTYFLLAHGQNRLFLIGELLWSGLFFGGLVALLPSVGLMATSVAYVAAFVGYLAFLTFAVRRVDGLRLDGKLWAAAAVILALALVLIGLAALDDIAGLVGGVVAVVVLGYVSLDRLARILGGQGRVGRLLARLKLGRGP